MYLTTFRRILIDLYMDREAVKNQLFQCLSEKVKNEMTLY